MQTLLQNSFMLHHRYRKTRTRPTNVGIGMADLAFVMLAFFVLTIVPSAETGFLMKMEPWSEEPPPLIRMSTRNLFHISLHSNDKLYLQADSFPLASLRPKLIEFITNPHHSPELAENPWQAKVIFKYDDQIRYEDFIKVLSIIRYVYRELWDKEALKRFKKHYSELSISEKRFIRALIPLSFEENPFMHC